MFEIQFIKTSGGCPEQYDAFIGEKNIGFLRLRNGFFFVEYKGKKVYEANPRGDGIFEADERDYYLNEAKKAIWKEIHKEVSEELNTY